MLPSRSRVICDGFSYVERRILAAYIIRAHATFRDDASNHGFKTRGHFSFLEPVQHQLGLVRSMADQIGIQLRITITADTL